MVYLIGVNAFGATRSLEHFWSGILDPVGFLYSDAIARYWTVVERNSQLFSWSVHAASGVFLYNRLLWGSVGLLSLLAVWKLFPMVPKSSPKSRPEKAKTVETKEPAHRPPR
jgi:ABC-2 type transport system permease protein